MKRTLLLGVLCAAATAACLNWTDGIACRTDNHCPDDMHCGADGGCLEGATPTDAGVTPRPDAGRRDGG
jgi:hypothetical protein